jgi:hypothetical protein
MSPRLFKYARFGLYLLVIGAGIHHLATRDDARGAPSDPAGEWVRGKTTQGLPVHVKVDDHRVVAVEVSWRGRCSNGRQVVISSGFVDAYRGDFERDGQRFADEWKQSGPGWEGQTGHLSGRLRGEASGAVARGTTHFALDVEEGGEIFQTCESGAVGFALDLPG